MYINANIKKQNKEPVNIYQYNKTKNVLFVFVINNIIWFPGVSQYLGSIIINYGNINLLQQKCRKTKVKRKYLRNKTLFKWKKKHGLGRQMILKYFFVFYTF